MRADIPVRAARLTIPSGELCGTASSSVRQGPPRPHTALLLTVVSEGTLLEGLLVARVAGRVLAQDAMSGCSDNLNCGTSHQCDPADAADSSPPEAASSRRASRRTPAHRPCSPLHLALVHLCADVQRDAQA